MSMKGQASTEYLILLAVGIAMLGISIAALSTIRGAGEAVYSNERARIAAYGLAAAAEEVCALGDGNSRSYPMEGVCIECSGGTITANAGEEGVPAEIDGCEVECGGCPAEAMVENVAGRVRIG